MKKVIFSLFISSVLFLVGCQENSMTNPVSSDLVNKASLTHETTLRGTITLDQRLANPVIKGNPDYIVNGKINYTESISPQNGPQITAVASTTAPRIDVGLDISVDATVKGVSSTKAGQNEWKIFSDSKDQVFVNEDVGTVLVKSYPLPGRTDNLELVCTFTVTAKGIRLDSVILNSPMMQF
ncbi:MAG TPA: hypothetical protein VLB50_13030 [Ignavibacteriaceae bacterium]|nr:hypothetical protein [Ignavibacteriaceae bacterium]